jgi:hypothetical protein
MVAFLRFELNQLFSTFLSLEASKGMLLSQRETYCVLLISCLLFFFGEIAAVHEEKLNMGENKNRRSLMKKEIQCEEGEMLYCGNPFRETQSLADKQSILFCCQYNPSPSSRALLFFQTIHSSTKGKPLN